MALVDNQQIFNQGIQKHYSAAVKLEAETIESFPRALLMVFERQDCDHEGYRIADRGAGAGEVCRWSTNRHSSISSLHSCS